MIILNFLTYFLSFSFVILLVVFIHEFGHFYMARKFGVKVEQFSLGFGKKLFSFFDKKGTKWQLSLLPFGGYVKMYGDKNPASSPDFESLNNLSDEEKKLSFYYKPLYQKSLIVAAGPIANILSAFLMLFVFFFISGKNIIPPTISSVIKNSAASEAGLQIGDTILFAENKKINSFTQLQEIVSLNTGTPINLKLSRNGKEIELSLTPKISDSADIFGNKIKLPVIGITSGNITHKNLSFFEAIYESGLQTYTIAYETIKSFHQIITGKRNPSEITGPIGIVKYSGQAAKQGWKTLLWLIVFISINLGLVNLFPIPILDGGHLLYYAIEAIFRKPIAEKFQQWGLIIGMLFIGALSLFAIINDITNFLK